MTASPGSLRVEIIRPLSVYRSWIILAMLVFGLGVGALRYLSQTQYTVTTILLPTSTNDQAGGGQGAGLSALAGLANLRGIGAGRAVSPFERFMYLVNSPELGQWQIQHHDVRPTLFPKQWDAEHKTWKPREGFMASLFGSHEAKAPDAYDVEREYDSHLSVKKMMSGSDVGTSTSLTSLTYTDPSPERATAVLNSIIGDANELLRQDAAVRASVQADYLRDKLATVTVQDYRETLQRLLSEQEQTLMLTNSHLPYAAQMVSGQMLEPAMAPKRTLLFAVVGAGFGFCLAYMLAILHYNLRRDRVSRIGKQPDRVPVIASVARTLGLAKAH